MFVPSFANSVCEVNAGITPSNKAISVVAVQNSIFSFFIVVRLLVITNIKNSSQTITFEDVKLFQIENHSLIFT